ncbi:MAG: PqiC family protein [Pseudomonadales bacterium]
MKQPLPRFLLACAAVALSACASSPPVSYFRLDPVPREARTASAHPAVVTLGPLQFPEYLRRQQMVVRGTGTSLIVDDYHRWAEPLDLATTRALGSSLEALLAGAAIVVEPGMPGFDPDYRLTGSVVQFEADARGVVTLVAHWSLRRADGTKVAAPRLGTYDARASATDPGPVAEAMAAALAQWSRDIAGELRADVENLARSG